MRLTALGWLIVVKPDVTGNGAGWELVYVNAAGNYQGGQVNIPTRAAALAKRRELVAYHRKLARTHPQWVQRAVVRMGKPK